MRQRTKLHALPNLIRALETFSRRFKGSSLRLRERAALPAWLGENRQFFKFLPPTLTVWLLILRVLLNGTTALAQSIDHGAPEHTVDGAFIREWLVLGPFSSRDMETDFLADSGGEANVRPREGDTITTKDGKKRVWTRLRSTRDVVNLEQILSAMEWSVVYAYCELNSAEAIDTNARIGASTAATLWLNGKSVLHFSTQERTELLPAVSIRLNTGRNPCLLKLRFEFEPPYAFMFQPLPPQRSIAGFHVVDPGGRPVPGALIQFYDRGESVARFKTDTLGRAEVCLYPLAAAYDVRVTSEESGAWLNGISLRARERRKFELILGSAISISGKVVAMDGSAQAAIVVQALRTPVESVSNTPGKPIGPYSAGFASDPWIKSAGNENLDSPSENTFSRGKIQSVLPTPPFSRTVLSDTNGNFQFVNLHAGQYRLRVHGPRGYVYPEGEMGPSSSKPLLVGPGRSHDGVRFIFPEAKKGSWTTYPMRKGLSEINPSRLHRTPDGLLWVGSFQRTLSAYDGVAFKDFSPPETLGSYVRVITHDASGTLWIGTDKGAGRVVNSTVEAIPFNDTLTNKDVGSILPDPDGKVWFSTTSGLIEHEGQRFRRWSIKEGAPSNGIGALLRTREGALWMSTSRSVARFDGQNFEEPVQLWGLRRAARDRLYQAKDGAIWFCSPMNDLAVYRYDGKTLSRLGEEDGLADDRVWDICQTSDGAMWFATHKGISRFDGRTILTYTTADGLSWGDVLDIFVDSDDSLWCATYTDISKFDAASFTGITKRDGLTNKQNQATSVFAIEPDGKENYLLGTEWGGVYRLESKADDRLTKADFLSGSYVRHIRRSADGTLWFGTADGIYKQAEGRTQKVLERNWILALNTDSQGQVWFGHGWAGGGLSRYNPETRAVTSFTQAEGLPNDGVWALAPSTNGGMWIGTADGLARFQNGKIENVNKSLGISPGTVSGIGRDADGTLWIGCDAGVFRLNGTNVVLVNAKNAEPFWCSTRTADGIIWLGTDKYGLVGYDGQAMTMLDKRDGLLGNSVFSLRSETDGSLLIGFLGNGLTHYRRTKSSPSVRIVELELEEGVFSEFSHVPTTDIGRRVSVQYQEIDLKTHPEKRQFKYRVQDPSGKTLFAGLTKDRRFEWTPRKGGTYRFQVQAIDRDLNYSKPAELSFRATVPWYANSWITLPGGGLFGGLVIWAIVGRALYVRKSREAVVLRERVRIARDLHDHLGAGLTHLAMVGDLVRDQTDRPAEVKMLATRLSESARELTRTMGEVIWATDPEKDTLRSFALFVTRYAERFFGDSAVRLRFELPAELPEITVPAEARNSLFMVSKEALNNVAKHSNASELRIKLELVERELCLSFEDNGTGFVATEVLAKGHGLGNMEKRLRDLGGQLRMESVVGKGTIIQVCLRLPKK
jgi:ligand-binding sensor domain-containing protein/signal transduction histidine kinase